jgi:hypothetical protein
LQINSKHAFPWGIGVFSKESTLFLKEGALFPKELGSFPMKNSLFFEEVDFLGGNFLS